MFPDVNGLLINYLTPLLDPVSVVSRIPDPRPSRLLQVRRVGGPASVPVRDTARIDIKAWDETDDQDAMQLALEARTHVWALAGTNLLGGLTCYRVEEFLGPRLDDDPVTKWPVAWMTLTLLVRANDAVVPAP